MTEELDLQEQARRDDVFDRIEDISERMEQLAVFPPLVWVYAWNLIRDIWAEYEYHSAIENGEFEAVPDGVDLKQVWDRFWDTADDLGWSLEWGAENISEQAWDFMRENDFLVELDEEDDEVLESDKEEV